MFERSKDAVFLTGDDLVFRDVNTATCQLFKYTKEEMLRTEPVQLVCPRENRPRT